MSDERITELLALNQRLLDSIAQANWAAYQELCLPDLTCFEPEARGQLVEGMAFHKFYFDLGSDGRPCQNTMASPRIRLLGDDVALVAYVRLVQRLGSDDAPRTTSVEETRLWQRIDGRWRHIHFHRSAPGS
jgi:calcium/calmodulin-dependent protein kinase (CaM kinase) II